MEKDIEILENFFEDRMDVEEEKCSLERILKTFRLLNSKLIHLSDEEYRNVIELAQKDSIPKSKVKEKIEELELEFHFYAGREHSEWQDGEFDGEVCDDIALKIGVLKELLREG